MAVMKIIDVIGNIDAQRHLTADVSDDVSPGPVRIAVLPLEEAAEDRWTRFVAGEWSQELADPRQDLYTLEDGYPIDIAR